MASTMRQSTDTLKEETANWFAELESAPYRFDFFSVLRFIDARHADKPRIGEAIKACDEAMVLRQEPSMAFAASSISHVDSALPDRGDDSHLPDDSYDQKHQIYNLGFGLFGPNGPMPLHITEKAFSRKHNYGDITLSRFADIFHHRMLSLFYRADANTQPVIEMDRPEHNQFDLFVGALAGLSNKNDYQHQRENKKNHLRDHWNHLYRSGLLAMESKSADGLKSLLQDFLATQVEIIQFSGGWLQLSDNDQCRLQSFGGKFQLGVNTTLGKAVFDVQHKFTVSIGALDLKQFRRLLPITDDFTQLRKIIRLYSGDQYDWDIELKLREEQIPMMQLGVKGELGWTTWMGKPDVEGGCTRVCLSNQGF